MLVSCLVTMALTETGLRLFTSRYEYAADAIYARNAERIWAREAGSREMREHSDSGLRFPVFHNNLSMRQHRNIPVRPAEDEIRIGFFGDSFTENVRVPAPYAFPEVLDYLLNRHALGVTTLNFGVDGYGTGQSYLAFRDLEAAQELDYVVYVFCSNDIKNLYENGLFRLDARGGLVQKPPDRLPWWTRLLSRMHVTYAWLDLRGRLLLAFGLQRSVPPPGEVRHFSKQAARQLKDEKRARYNDAEAERINTAVGSGVWDADSEYPRVFTVLLSRWRQEAEARGAHFLVLLVAREEESRLADVFRGYEVIDLYRVFRDQGYEPAQWTFENDPHWDEVGNRLTAIALYGHLAPQLGVAPDDPARIAADLERYYAAWPALWPARFGPPPAPPAPDAVRALRARYTPLEDG